MIPVKPGMVLDLGHMGGCLPAYFLHALSKLSTVNVPDLAVAVPLSVCLHA